MSAHWAIAAGTAMEHRAASVLSMYPILSGIALTCAAISAAVLLWFLFTKPQLTGQVKVLLLLGLGVFPIGAAATGNLAGFEHTKNRPFCGSCHVMTPYRVDAENPLSTSLAAAHARNEELGPNNCYHCHREYGSFSTVLTKIGGMRHVYEYYTHYKDVDVDTAIHEIELYKPLANASCMSCHSTEVSSWLKVSDHGSSLALVRAGKLSCVSEGCHGPAHPFSKPKRPVEGGAP